MSEYSKLKNAELENLLKARGLPHTGKKADMVARLQEDDDKSSGTGGGAPAAPAPATAEDEIDWDDDGPATDASKPAAAADTAKSLAAQATTEADKTAIAAGGKGRVDNPRSVPNQKADEVDPAKTDDLSVTNPAEGGEPAKPAEDFTKGLATTTWEQELEKRRARAKKFGVEFDEEKEKEQLKLVERAKKFGEEMGAPKGLNEALPERREKKRGRDQHDEGRNGNTKRGPPRGGPPRRGDQRRNGPPRNGPPRNGPPRNDNRRNDNRGEAPKSGGGPNWMNEKDRAAAEARKAKWAKV